MEINLSILKWRKVGAKLLKRGFGQRGQLLKRGVNRTAKV